MDVHGCDCINLKDLVIYPYSAMYGMHNQFKCMEVCMINIIFSTEYTEIESNNCLISLTDVPPSYHEATAPQAIQQQSHVC